MVGFYRIRILCILYIKMVLLSADPDPETRASLYNMHKNAGSRSKPE